MGQLAKLLDYVETHDGVTVLEAFSELRICSLHSRLAELRRLGINFEDSWETTPGGARVVRHRLNSKVAYG